VELPASLLGPYQQSEFNEIIAPETPVQRQELGGLVEFEQTAEFSELSKVHAARMRFSLERIDKGLLGMRADTYRLTGWLRSLEGDHPDRDQVLGTERDHFKDQAPAPAQPLDPDTVRANQLLTAGMAGRFITVGWQVPGKIIDVWKLNIGGRLVTPQVIADQGKVTWRIPLALLATAKVRHNLMFMVEFKGDVRNAAGAPIIKQDSNWGPQKAAPAKDDKKPKDGNKPPEGEGAKP